MAKKKVVVSFEERIKERIQSSGMSQADICESAGVSSSILSRFMTGQRLLRVDTAERICRVVGLDLVEVRDS